MQTLTHTARFVYRQAFGGSELFMLQFLGRVLFYFALAVFCTLKTKTGGKARALFSELEKSHFLRDPFATPNKRRGFPRFLYYN